MADDKPVEKKWSELVKPLKDIEVGTPKGFTVLKETIPIIFVPGIMGSRLKKAAGGDKLWDPDDKLFMLRKYGMFWVDAADKKKAVIGDVFKKTDLEPLADDAKHNQKFASVEGAAKRGWGTVSWGTYGEILQKLNDPNTWPPAMRAFFDLPVYAFGYNWAASNVDGGEALNTFIDGVIKENSDPKKPKGICEKVILVTHSMGGLLSREAIRQSQGKHVLGAIHGVMPATGAAAAYWRMKAGFERGMGGLLPNPAAWVLGTNGAEVTALLGWIPGGLQLLPGPQYTDNDGGKDWLKLTDEQGRVTATYPKSDCYQELYLNREETAFYRLIKEEYLLPGKRNTMKPAAAWDLYARTVLKAKEFHQNLGVSAHAETQVFYGAGKKHKTTDQIVFKMTPRGWKQIAWDAFKIGKAIVGATRGPVGIAGLAFEVLKRTEYWQSRGGFKVRIEADEGSVDVELQQPSGAGDGTVPESSGKAVQQKGEAIGGRQPAKAFAGIEHEPAYHADQVDQRGVHEKVWDFVKDKLGGDPYELPEDNTVSFTVSSVLRLCFLKIKKAKG